MCIKTYLCQSPLSVTVINKQHQTCGCFTLFVVILQVTFLENVRFIFCILKWLCTREYADPTTSHAWCELRVFRSASSPSSNAQVGLGQEDSYWKEKNWIFDVLNIKGNALKRTVWNVHLKEFQWDGEPPCQVRHGAEWGMFYVYMFVRNASFYYDTAL